MANIGHVDVNDLLGSEAGVDLTPVITKIDAVKADTASIKTDVGVIKTESATIKADVAIIKTNTTPA